MDMAHEGHRFLEGMSVTRFNRRIFPLLSYIMYGSECGTHNGAQSLFTLPQNAYVLGQLPD